MTANSQNGTPSRPNFYILLELDPSRPFDELEFSTKIVEKLKKWKQKLNNGTTEDQREASRHLRFESEIRTVMHDPVRRGEEAAACNKLRASAREKRIAEYQSALSIVATSSAISEEAVAKLLEYRDVVPEPEIRSDIERIRQSNPAVPEPAILGAARRQEIARKLNFIHESTLYCLVKSEDKKNSDGNPNLDLGSPYSDWRDAAHRVYIKLKNNMNKSADPELDTKYDLASIAETCFSSDENRQQYDNTLEYQKVEVLLNQYLDLCGSTRHINSKQLDRYLTRAHELGCDGRLAYGFLLLRIKAYQKDRQDQQAWVIAPFPTQPTESPAPIPPPPPPKTQRCGNPACRGAENDATRATCATCGEPLRIHCPNCERDNVPADAATCTCGFRIGQRFEVTKLVREGRHQLIRGQLAEAQISVHDANERWQPKTRDTLAKEIAALQRDVDKHRGEIEQQERDRQAHAKQEKKDQEQREALRGKLAELDHLIRERKYFAAQRLADMLPTSTPERVEYHSRIGEQIASAHRLLEQAKRGAESERQEALCRQALDLCADYDEARDWLRTLPPAPPRNLTAVVEGRAVHLTWAASPAREVRYFVIRKVGAAPRSSTDGVRIYSGTAPGYQDTLEPGQFTYYAVYAERNGVTSRNGADLASPTLSAADVRDAACRPGDGMIELTWRTPPNAERVLIVRKAGSAPRSRGDPDVQTITPTIAPTDANTLVDRDVRNGSQYFYALYCCYLDDHRRQHYSQGVVVSGTPDTPPTEVPRLRITGHASVLYAGSHVIEFVTATPPKGELVVLRCDQPPRLPSSLPASDLAAYGNVLRLTSTDLLKDPRTYWYVPIIRYHGIAYPGAPERYAWTTTPATGT